MDKTNNETKNNTKQNIKSEINSIQPQFGPSGIERKMLLFGGLVTKFMKFITGNKTAGKIENKFIETDNNSTKKKIKSKQKDDHFNPDEIQKEVDKLVTEALKEVNIKEKPKGKKNTNKKEPKVKKTTKGKNN